MPGAFWTSWQLWEKLCFILAAAIVVVILLGIAKLTYNDWKLRKYTKIAAEKLAIKHEMQHSKSVRRGRAKDVPFGVRALESGIEVEGVWISRTNTPASSIAGSPALSATTLKPTGAQPESSADRTSSASNMSHLEISRGARAQPEVNPPSNSSLTVPQPFSHPSRNHGPPPASDHHQIHGRPTYQPRRASHLRYSNSFGPEEAETLADLDDQPEPVDRHGKRPEVSRSGADDRRPSMSWSRSSGESGNEDLTRSRQSDAPSDDFPRPEYRTPPDAYALNRYVLADRSTHGANQQLRPQRGGSEDAADGGLLAYEEGGDPFDTPDDSVMDGRSSTFDRDNDIANQHTQLMDNNEITYDRGHAQPVHPFDGNRRLRRSEVIRKVNPGFQILRPGTLNAPDESNDPTGAKDESGRGKKRETRKLQKRERASSASSYSLER